MHGATSWRDGAERRGAGERSALRGAGNYGCARDAVKESRLVKKGAQVHLFSRQPLDGKSTVERGSYGTSCLDEATALNLCPWFASRSAVASFAAQAPRAKLVWCPKGLTLCTHEQVLLSPMASQKRASGSAVGSGKSKIWTV